MLHALACRLRLIGRRIGLLPYSSYSESLGTTYCSADKGNWEIRHAVDITPSRLLRCENLCSLVIRSPNGASAKKRKASGFFLGNSIKTKYGSSTKVGLSKFSTILFKSYLDIASTIRHLRADRQASPKWPCLICCPRSSCTALL